MENCFETYNNDDIVQVVVLSNLRKNFHVEDETNAFDITCLETLSILEQPNNNIPNTEHSDDDDSCLQRVSLAYESLHSMPKILVQEIASYVNILDISHNEFDNLDFLKEFHQLSYLICDHNNITARTDIPYLPKLELLWMNHCKIIELIPWITKLQSSCPNLKYLSVMKNPISTLLPSCGGIQEFLNYRLLIISLFPKLLHLDDEAVTRKQKRDARIMFQRPPIERLVQNTQRHLPVSLRVAPEKIPTKFSLSFISDREKNGLI